MVAVASVEQDALGRDLFQEPDHCEVMTQPITKWYWAAKTTGSIPETVRRGMKFASTSPCGPVFLSLPTNTLREEANATIWDRASSTCATPCGRQGQHRQGRAPCCSRPTR